MVKTNAKKSAKYTMVNELSSKYTNLIVDNAHSFFSEPKGVASFSSLRKFFNQVRDGSFLYIKSDFSFEFQQDDYSYKNFMIN